MKMFCEMLNQYAPERKKYFWSNQKMPTMTKTVLKRNNEKIKTLQQLSEKKNGRKQIGKEITMYLFHKNRRETDMKTLIERKFYW